MPRASPLLIRLLAAVLLLQSATAMAHCLRGMSGGWLVELCAAGERRTVVVDAEGREVPPTEGIAAVFCPVCHALPAVVAPEVPGVSAPVAYAVGPAWRPVTDAALGPPARAPPYPTRAPPVPA
jgi:hypothetical protein